MNLCLFSSSFICHFMFHVIFELRVSLNLHLFPISLYIKHEKISSVQQIACDLLRKISQKCSVWWFVPGGISQSIMGSVPWFFLDLNISWISIWKHIIMFDRQRKVVWFCNKVFPAFHSFKLSWMIIIWFIWFNWWITLLSRTSWFLKYWN